MKILIRQKGRELFLGRNNYWVDRPDKAITFTSGVEAIEYLAHRGIMNVEIYYSFADRSENFAVPIGPGSSG
jgi:hypothetical protein